MFNLGMTKLIVQEGLKFQEIKGGLHTTLWTSCTSQRDIQHKVFSLFSTRQCQFLMLMISFYVGTMECGFHGANLISEKLEMSDLEEEDLTLQLKVECT